MTKIFSKALNQTIEVDRVINKIQASKQGPTIIFTGGIHGNEPSGVFALDKVFKEIEANNTYIDANVYGICGNLWALERGERFQEQDLNRVWKGNKMRQLEYGELLPENEDVQQQIEIYKVLQEIIETEPGPFYFMDLHTTSSETIPFLTVNDSILNRKFTRQYPVPIILGIEEYLDGPLLSYINKLGYVAFGYEGGQHDDLAAIENHVSFIYLSLVYTGAVAKKDIDFQHHHAVLAKNSIDKRNFYEIFYRHEIKENVEYKMWPGYVNFQTVKKGNQMASSNSQHVFSPHKGRVFMPLYQSQGNDGYFLIRRISPFFLRVSGIVRKWRLDRLLAWFPGIRWASEEKHALLVNRKIARIFTKQIFHLLGYRSRELNERRYYMRNREATSRTDDYKEADWN